MLRYSSCSPSSPSAVPHTHHARYQKQQPNPLMESRLSTLHAQKTKSRTTTSPRRAVSHARATSETRHSSTLWRVVFLRAPIHVSKTPIPTTPRKRGEKKKGLKLHPMHQVPGATCRAVQNRFLVSDMSSFPLLHLRKRPTPYSKKQVYRSTILDSRGLGARSDHFKSTVKTPLCGRRVWEELVSGRRA
ncbi:hypothetical protein BU26DRAFT_501575 [Trematosphaeria pertusa]|uniref:Uncharacterized protein n=1 Tax=Trematosphaeria pertusa TaxID=390896 RepID=A0A6A6ISK3_9PLEO|nr:uncharacterized protein BU26DRAFT_501575 [Trematosphaeria pertusa]KAF2253386.1 hypothetical protein BU26DRAFT_501575 [Trematosphaeria pertusa]